MTYVPIFASSEIACGDLWDDFGGRGMICVMFATRNGAAVLPRTLAALARVRPPDGGWSILAVDNGSSDGSVDLLRSYQDRLPLTVMDEPTAGKNRALNRALEVAAGDLFVFCDDDIEPAEDWLVRWREAADAHPDFDLFAGATRPAWPQGVAASGLDDQQTSIVFGVNEHMREGPCDAACMLGTNMAIRPRAFADGVRFDPGIGPSAARMYPMGSETELARRLAARGLRCWFAPGPSVGHIIRPAQLARRSILLRGYRWGRGQAHMGVEHHYAPALLSRKNRLRAALYPVALPFLSPGEAWARQWEWVADQGYEDGWRERRGLPPVWLGHGEAPRIVRRFRAETA